MNYRRHLCQGHRSRPSSASPPLFRLLHQPHLLLSSPIFRIFFQVPYPATPLFATLTKTAGVCINNSHCGTQRSHTCPCHSLPPVHCRPHLLSFQTLAHSIALLCTNQKLNSFVFILFRTLRQKTKRSRQPIRLPDPLSLRKCHTDQGLRFTDDEFSRRPAARRPALPPAGRPSPTASSHSNTSTPLGGYDVSRLFHHTSPGCRLPRRMLRFGVP